MHLPSEYSTSSICVTEFEDRMRDYFGRDVVAVTSGTDALFLSLFADISMYFCDVVVPVLTFVATANAVRQMRGSVVFCDVDIETWCGGVDDSPYLRCLPVDIYGVVSGFSGKIKDACESFGIKQDIPIACYSFNGNKIITTGAGGLVVGNNLDRIRTLANVGRNENEEFIEAGFNMRMAGINAKLGLDEFGHLDERLKWQKRVNEVYRNELPFKFQEDAGNGSTWWYTACLLPESVDVVQTVNMLNSLNIDCGVKPARRVFRPLNQEIPYCDGKSYPVAEYVYEHGICLPQPKNEKGLRKICQAIKQSQIYPQLLLSI